MGMPEITVRGRSLEKIDWIVSDGKEWDAKRYELGVIVWIVPACISLLLKNDYLWDYDDKTGLY